MNLLLRIDSECQDHVHAALYVNDSLVSCDNGLAIRQSELADFIDHIKPTMIEVDREMITEETIERVVNFPTTKLI